MNIGPVTIGLVALLAVLSHNGLPDVCLSPNAVMHGEIHRLMLYAFFHPSQGHLMHSVTSLLVKGRYLEPALGSYMFAWMILSFAFATGCLMVLGSFILDPLIPDLSLMERCDFGFVGVLFALNTVLANLPGSWRHSIIMGIHVPPQYFTVFEFILLTVLMPQRQQSFVCIASGIAVGFAYVSQKFDFLFKMPMLLMQPEHYLNSPNSPQQQMFVDENGILRRQ